LDRRRGYRWADGGRAGTVELEEDAVRTERVHFRMPEGMR
jgi:hypothetical protein